MDLITFMLPFQDDPTADHNQLSHVPREPLRASQNRVSERADQYVGLIFLAL
jgi:hypothetical protein